MLIPVLTIQCLHLCCRVKDGNEAWSFNTKINKKDSEDLLHLLCRPSLSLFITGIFVVCYFVSLFSPLCNQDAKVLQKQL